MVFHKKSTPCTRNVLRTWSACKCDNIHCFRWCCNYILKRKYRNCEIFNHSVCLVPSWCLFHVIVMLLFLWAAFFLAVAIVLIICMHLQLILLNLKCQLTNWLLTNRLVNWKNERTKDLAFICTSFHWWNYYLCHNFNISCARYYLYCSIFCTASYIYGYVFVLVSTNMSVYQIMRYFYMV